MHSLALAAVMSMDSRYIHLSAKNPAAGGTFGASSRLSGASRTSARR